MNQVSSFQSLETTLRKDNKTNNKRKTTLFIYGCFFLFIFAICTQPTQYQGI
jgi:hypothetical protein